MNRFGKYEKSYGDEIMKDKNSLLIKFYEKVFV